MTPTQKKIIAMYLQVKVSPTAAYIAKKMDFSREYVSKTIRQWKASNKNAPRGK